MTAPTAAMELREAFGEALVDLGERAPLVAVVVAGPAAAAGAERFAHRFASRCQDVGPNASTAIAVAARLAESGRIVFACADPVAVTAGAYLAVRDAVAVPRAAVKIVGVPAFPPTRAGGGAPAFGDLALMRGLPQLAIAAPADGPSTRAAVAALHARPGPAYLRLAPGRRPSVTDGTFEFGRAAELRPGHDLTVVALGEEIAPALELADDLAAVGISTRVLDFASVRPFDEPALLRAARDTGAILVLEEPSVSGGIGALVAQATAENYPVPVRRVGRPDRAGTPDGVASLPDGPGGGIERLHDEAWELLRMRGKVQ